MYETITDIPAELLNWLLLNGWRVIDITYDDMTLPPTPYYTMTRKTLQNL